MGLSPLPGKRINPDLTIFMSWSRLLIYVFDGNMKVFLISAKINTLQQPVQDRLNR